MCGSVYGSVGRPVHHFGPELDIYTTTTTFHLFSEDIHGLQLMNPNDFGNSLTFPLSSIVTLTFMVSWKTTEEFP